MATRAPVPYSPHLKYAVHPIARALNVISRLAPSPSFCSSLSLEASHQPTAVPILEMPNTPLATVYPSPRSYSVSRRVSFCKRARNE